MVKKYSFFLVLFLMLGCLPVYADVDFGFNLGALSPWDKTMRQTFNQDFYFQGHLGAVNENGWGVRANLGRYASDSHNPADIGTNFQLSVVPLTASVIYHFFGQSSFFQPYLGAGVGAYFYSLRDDLFGDLESGTRFGPHLLGGVKFHINSSTYVSAEYNHAFMSKIFFNRSANFNASTFTLGFGFLFPTNPTPRASVPQKPRYSQHEQEMLTQMAQLKTEVSQMREKRKELQGKIDAFYESTDVERDPDFAQEYQKTKYMEDKVKNLDGKINQAQTQLNVLEKQWELEHQADRVAVEQHVIYYHDHYYGRPSYGRRPYSRPIPRYYYAHDYAVPTYVAPKPVTVDDRKRVIEKKREYIRDLKNR